MKKLYSIIAVSLIIGSTSAQSLSGVESVEYDPINNRYLASSDNSSIVAIAPNGALSYFGSGTDASHGMEVFDGRLFAINGSQIKAYDLVSENQLFSTSISGASFLNGMASNGVDSIWFTDFSGKDIYAMDVNNPTDYTMIVQNVNIASQSLTPNGIVYDGDNNRCLFVTWGTGTVRAMNLNNYALSTVVASTGLSNIDGIDKDGLGNWFISSWNPARITKYNNDFSTMETITVPGISSPADICYATETDTLAIPGANQVLFVGFENSSVGIDEENFESHQIYYNSGYPILRFDLSQAQEATLDIVDMSGRVVYTVLEGIQPSGAQTVVLSSIGLYSGNYVCRLVSKELSFSDRIVIP